MEVSASEISEIVRAAVPDAPAASLQELSTDLLMAWGEPWRAYHTPQHLAECLAAFAEVRGTLCDPAAVGLALLFHDAIYDPARSDNEVRSADWASEALLAMGAKPMLRTAVKTLVLATQHHEPAGEGVAATDLDALLDIDLAILGSTPARFAEYEEQIRREYAFVPEAEFKAARQRVMRGFAARRPLYRSAYFQLRLEAAARRNLAAFA